MRAVYTVGHKVYSDGAKDAHGNVVPGWADPVDLAVYWIAPGTSEEPGADRTAVVTTYSIGVPPDSTVDAKDLFVIDGEDWKVEGEIADYTRGPFGYRPGAVVNLTRAKG